jgi:hypothetical protein
MSQDPAITAVVVSNLCGALIVSARVWASVSVTSAAELKDAVMIGLQEPPAPLNDAELEATLQDAGVDLAAALGSLTDTTAKSRMNVGQGTTGAEQSAPLDLDDSYLGLAGGA